MESTANAATFATNASINISTMPDHLPAVVNTWFRIIIVIVS